MKICPVIMTILIVIFSSNACSGEIDTDLIERQFIHNYDVTVRELTASVDFSKEEKVKNYLDSGFVVARKVEVKRLYGFIPKELHRLIDGKIYIYKDTGLATHFIFFILDPSSWIRSLKAKNSPEASWFSPGSENGRIKKPFLLIDFEKGLSFTITFWEKSPPTCQITELDL